ncbi:hypothetical protein [Polyangium sp. 15x6]|uniref:hypothetical protein n=1 Tax=Polyangium sp. 15x6 TaxID=3042687 RepID=UPI00249CE5BE|nr:hypothetical protein [Polyangium sp. 15x6]MDI3282094.1 hypothetical protein [Polyangium sp. 15x6]
MAIKFSRGEEGEFVVTDSATGETRIYVDRDAWLADALGEVLRATERIDAGLVRLEKSYARSSSAADDDVEVPTWP